MKDKNTEYNLRRRSLAELDDVIEESLKRNPDFIDSIEEIIKQQLAKNERTNS